VWDEEAVAFEITQSEADRFVEELYEGSFRTNDNNEYSETSKRKFLDALETYFSFKGKEWDPTIRFSDSEPSCGSDPFTKRESQLLFNTALEYNSPPNYKNVGSEERDRWNSHLAQVIGKSKDQVGPDDWQELRRSWKIPSLISVSQDGGLRAAIVGRLETNLVNIDAGHIVVPPEKAVKNEQTWKITLSQRSISILQKWLSQRTRNTKYDDSDLIWLNRKGNPYNSKSLNNLLGNLIQEAGIEATQRKLTWHSIRHSTGMYVYNQERDLELVAEFLRQKSLQSAKKYAHPTPETKSDIVESIQGGRSR
jgi:site-specific recombinase XerD